MADQEMDTWARLKVQLVLVRAVTRAQDSAEDVRYVLETAEISRQQPYASLPVRPDGRGKDQRR